MKTLLREKLESDEKTNHKLLKLDEKGVSYDSLWDDRLHSKVSSVFVIFCDILFIN